MGNSQLNIRSIRESGSFAIITFIITHTKYVWYLCCCGFVVVVVAKILYWSGSSRSNIYRLCAVQDATISHRREFYVVLVIAEGRATSNCRSDRQHNSLFVQCVQLSMLWHIKSFQMVSIFRFSIKNAMKTIKFMHFVDDHSLSHCRFYCAHGFVLYSNEIVRQWTPLCVCVSPAREQRADYYCKI